MKHCDSELLALVALGDGELSPDDVAHTRECVQCRDELASLIDVVSLSRHAGDISLVEPPEPVWRAVRNTIDTDEQPLASRRRLTVYLAAAACVAAVVGSFILGRSLSPTSTGTQIASTALSALPGQPADTAGNAILLERDGNYSLDVQTSGLPATQGFYEVWLMGTDSGLVSVGTVSAAPGHTVLTLPTGFPVSQFPVVDISEEPFDGKPEHSAVSVLRGELSV